MKPKQPSVAPCYDDILPLPHPSPAHHPRMPRSSRAAQFAPFAALSGHDAALLEQARLTTPRRALDADLQAQIDRKLTLLHKNLHAHPLVEIVYFRPDARKDGGAYDTVQGQVRKIDLIAGLLILQDGTCVPMADIASLESPLFSPASLSCDTPL